MIFACDVLHDFTGGVTESYTFKDEQTSPQNIVNLLEKAFSRRSLICCNTDVILSFV